MSGILSDFSIDDVAEWLSKEKFPDVLIARFQDNFIDGDALLSLTESELVTLVPEVGLKKKLQKLLGLSATVDPGKTISPISITSEENLSNNLSTGDVSAVVVTTDQLERSDLITSGIDNCGTSDALQILTQIRNASLPLFSGLALKLLLDKRPEDDWALIVSQAADYYFSKFPAIGSPCHYKEIGLKMYQTYPCIAQTGKHPWSMFTKSLSQRIRHIRGSLKLKSLTLTGETVDGVPRKRLRLNETISSTSVDADKSEVNDVDITSHVAELKREWTSKNRNTAHLKMLLTHTQNYRKDLLRRHPSGSLKPIFDEFPCYQHSDFIMYDYKLTVGNERVKAVGLRMKRLLIAVDKIRGLSEDGPMAALGTLQYVENATMETTRRKKTAKTEQFQSLVNVVEDVDEADKSSQLVSDEQSPLQIIAFKNHGELSSLYIAGFGAVIEVPHKSGILGALLVLLMSYYVFDLKFPPRHAMALTVFQAIVLEEPPSGKLSQNCLFFMKKVRSAVEQMPADVCPE